MNVLNYTRGSSQVIRKLSFLCVQVADEVDIILPGPVKIFLLVSISSAYQRNQSLHYQITTKHIFCRKFHNKAICAHIVSSSMSFSSVLLVAVELPEVLLPSRGFTSSSVRQSTSRSPSDSSWTTEEPGN